MLLTANPQELQIILRVQVAHARAGKRCEARQLARILRCQLLAQRGLVYLCGCDTNMRSLCAVALVEDVSTGLLQRRLQLPAQLEHPYLPIHSSYEHALNALVLGDPFQSLSDAGLQGAQSSRDTRRFPSAAAQAAPTTAAVVGGEQLLLLLLTSTMVFDPYLEVL